MKILMILYVCFYEKQNAFCVICILFFFFFFILYFFFLSRDALWVPARYLPVKEIDADLYARALPYTL